MTKSMGPYMHELRAKAIAKGLCGMCRCRPAKPERHATIALRASARRRLDSVTRGGAHAGRNELEARDPARLALPPTLGARGADSKTTSPATTVLDVGSAQPLGIEGHVTHVSLRPQRTSVSDIVVLKAHYLWGDLSLCSHTYVYFCSHVTDHHRAKSATCLTARQTQV